jgi:hypothetical protein
MKRRGWLSLCALTWWASPRTYALPDAPESRALHDARAVDELDLARAAEDAGDARLLAALVDPAFREAAALAARAAPHARAPEALIPALAKLACGRDPTLAPEAGHALWQLAQVLSPSQLAAGEVLRHDLEQARQALACGEQAPAPRADIAIQLALLRATLDALLR